MVTVSCILTSYNKPETIASAIESVINQTFQDWELLIMDDNSNENIVKIIQRYLDDPRIEYFNSNIQDSERYRTTRYATLINEAIPKLRGKYITYLTDDNMFLPQRFNNMVDVLKRNSKIEIVYSKQLVKWFESNGKAKYEFIRRTRGVLTKAAGIVDHCSIMHTKKIINEIYRKYGGYWDDNPIYWFNGDATFWNRLTNIKPMHPIPEVLDIALKEPNSFQRLYAYLPKTIPNGTLVRGPSTDVYIIDNQERRKITDEVFLKLNYNDNQIVKIPDPFLFKYNEGTAIDINVFLNSSLLPNQRLIKALKNQTVYYFQRNKKHLIRNEKTFKDFKFKRDQIISISDDLVNQLLDGEPIEPLSNNMTTLPDGILFDDKINYYISFNNLLHPIEKRVAIKLKLPVTDPVRIGTSFLCKFNHGEPFNWHFVY